MYICPRSCGVQDMYVLGHAEYVYDMFRTLLHNCSHGTIGPEDNVDASPTDDLP